MIKNKIMKSNDVHTNFSPKNKRGWIKIIEAFTAILLIMGVVLLVLNKGDIGEKDFSEEIQEKEVSILREIELSNALRDEILTVDSLPVEWGVFNSSGLNDTKIKIIEETPSNLNCEAKLCEMNDDCLLSAASEENVYVQSVVIFANTETYSPRQLKLFCWDK
ncbi:hypothetical protein GOV13_05360 [Candidatus Pacearchaeota archaeon]|nr:hypothetical protein [Candidatus Pacearchaeota archaeon]